MWNLFKLWDLSKFTCSIKSNPVKSSFSQCTWRLSHWVLIYHKHQLGQDGQTQIMWIRVRVQMCDRDVPNWRWWKIWLDSHLTQGPNWAQLWLGPTGQASAKLGPNWTSRVCFGKSQLTSGLLKQRVLSVRVCLMLIQYIMVQNCFTVRVSGTSDQYRWQRRQDKEI